VPALEHPGAGGVSNVVESGGHWSLYPQIISPRSPLVNDVFDCMIGLLALTACIDNRPCEAPSIEETS